MKFDAYFEFKEPDYFKKVELEDAFIKHLEDLGTNYYDGVIESIISVHTDNKINQSGHKQGSGAPYIHEPLSGLYKVHCINPSLQSTLMNMGLSKLGIKISNNLESAFNIEFTPEKEEEILSECDKVQQEGGNLTSFIEKYSNQESHIALNQYTTKRVCQKLTGNWLIFGKSNNKNIFLYLSTGDDHSKKNDPGIYQTLVNMYSEEFIQNLKIQGKLFF